jgi:hypothetical protein
MKNTTKLKNLLQLYTIALDMDEDMNIHLTAMNKNTNSIETFIDRAYTVVIRKAYSHMLKEMKQTR